ncbi:MAG: DUF2007 domain-containing protein [Chlorobiota bacterium]|jgi:hypothetical protein|nr:MAG: DUF2007 domain-containing protein [Chlorobiota bacterium]
MNENFVIVERYTNPISAQLACGRLKAEGLFAILDDLYTIGANPLYSQAIGGIKLKVPEDEYERAKEILNQNFSEDFDIENN